MMECIAVLPRKHDILKEYEEPFLPCIWEFLLPHKYFIPIFLILTIVLMIIKK